MVPPSSTQRGPVLSSQGMVPADPLFLIVVVIGSIAVVYLGSCHDSSFRNTIFLLRRQRDPADSTGTPGMTFPACILYSVNEFMQALDCALTKPNNKKQVYLV